MYVPFIYGIILGLTHFFNDELDGLVHKSRDKIISFSGGVAIAYILLYLFPELVRSVNGQGYIFIFVLIGFSLFHIAEKHVYQHKSVKRRLRELKEVHSLAFFVYHLLIGIALYYVSSTDLILGLIFFIPLFLHTAVSNISFSEVHVHIKQKWYYRLFLSLPSLLGVALAFLVGIPALTYSIILAFIIGALLYVVVRDSIPKNSDGSIMFFVLGTFLMLALVVATGQI
jgi:zinc transporter ZupT